MSGVNAKLIDTGQRRVTITDEQLPNIYAESPVRTGPHTKDTIMNTTQAPASQKTEPKGLAVTALVLGIVSLVGALFGWGGVILGLVALIIGVIALKKSQPKGLSVTGIVTGSLGLIGGIIMLIITAMFMAALGASIETLETGDLSHLEELGVEFETE